MTSNWKYDLNFQNGSEAILNIKIEKHVYDVTVALILVVEQNECHIRTQRPKIYKNQCKNLQK